MTLISGKHSHVANHKLDMDGDAKIATVKNLSTNKDNSYAKCSGPSFIELCRMTSQFNVSLYNDASYITVSMNY